MVLPKIGRNLTVSYQLLIAGIGQSTIYFIELAKTVIYPNQRNCSAGGREMKEGVGGRGDLRAMGFEQPE